MRTHRAAGAPSVSSSRLLALFAAKDLDALIDAAFRILREAVACDFASAFYRYSDEGLLKERDSRGREYGPEFTRRFIELSPAIPVARANPGLDLLTTRAALPHSEADLKKSDFYREIMQAQGWRHAVALCFWSQPLAELPVFVASVYRREGRRDFSDADLIRLRSVHPFLSCAINRLHELEAAQSVRDGMAMTVRRGSTGVAVLDWNLNLVEANPVARRLCATWADSPARSRVNGARRAWRLPSALAEVCRELRSEQAGSSAGPDAAVTRRRSGILHPRMLGVVASISMICRSATGMSEPSFVIELEKTEKPEHRRLLLERMTAAERAVAMVVLDGLSNQEVADQLGKSVQAVKFLLHNIYSKTGVSNRAALVVALRSGHTGRA